MLKRFFILLFIVLFTKSFSQQAELVVPTFHTGKPKVFVLSNNGELLITASHDKALKIWDYKKGKELKGFQLDKEIHTVLFSKDNKYIVAHTTDHLILLDINTFEIVSKVEFPSYKYPLVNSIALGTRNNSILYELYNDSEKTMEVVEINFDGSNKKVIFSKPTESMYKAIDHIYTSPNQEYVLIDSRLGKFLVNLKTMQSTSISEDAKFFLPDNSLFFFNSSSNTLKAISPGTQQELWQHIATKLPYNSKYAYNRDFFIDVMHNELSYSQTHYTSNLLTVINFKTKEKTEFNQFEAIRHSQLAKVGEELLTVTYEPKVLKVFDLPTNTLKRELGKGIMAPQFIEGSATSATLAVGGFYNKEIKHINFSSGKLDVASILLDDTNYIIRLSENGNVIAGASEYIKTHVNLIVQNTRYKIPVKNIDNKVVDIEIALSKDGSKLGIIKGHDISIVDTKTRQTLFAENISKTASPTPGGEIFFSENDKFIVKFYSSNKDEKDILHCYSTLQKKLLWKSKSDYQNISFKDENTIIATGPSDNVLKKQVVELDANTGKPLNASYLSDLVFSYRQTNYNKSYTNLALKNKLDILIYNLQRGNIQTTLKGSKSNINDVSFYQDDFLFSCGGENVINLWDVKNSKHLAKIILYAQTNDWAIVTPNGLFDGSQDAIKDMYFRKGKSFIPLEQLYEKFYTPNLLSQLLSREINVNPNEDYDIEDLLPAPKAKLKYESGQRNLTVEDDEMESITTETQTAKITVLAEAPQSTITEIRLYHNGKLITNTSRNLTVEEDNTATNNKTYTVSLLEGENTFKALVLNSQRTESAPAELLVNYKPKTVIPKPKGIQLHLFVVGIDKYKNPKYNLNYAVADASGFQNAVEKGMSSITSNKNVYTINNEDASKQQIENTFQIIAENANPQDVFVFYYAGHGVMSQEAKPDFYLVPFDVTQLYGNDDGLKNKGISATALKALSAVIPAQKQLYVLDACQSAGALATVAMRGAAEEKAIAQLARSTGTHWLTASGSEQFATEFDELGHGVFTYALLEALSGKADSGDNRITVNEIKAYLESRVPEISEQYKGSPQYPSSFGFGQDFPISIKN